MSVGGHRGHIRGRGDPARRVLVASGTSVRGGVSYDDVVAGNAVIVTAGVLVGVDVNGDVTGPTAPVPASSVGTDNDPSVISSSAIAGVAVGGIVVAAVVVAMVMLAMRRRRALLGSPTKNQVLPMGAIMPNPAAAPARAKATVDSSVPSGSHSLPEEADANLDDTLVVPVTTE